MGGLFLVFRKGPLPSLRPALLCAALLATLAACGGGGGDTGTTAAPAPAASPATPSGTTPAADYPAVRATFGTRLSPSQLPNYAAQPVPAYITRDLGGVTSDAQATLGRVLFYDRALSVDQSVSCASCHQQRLAFGDSAVASSGVLGGTTARHSMRLVNARFADEARFFWDERAATLEQQTTMPVRDHAEMGFSGLDGRPGMAELLQRLGGLAYYTELFTLAFGDATVTEPRLQQALGQFVRSLQAFDTRFDTGRALAGSDIAPFANFTAQENLGKQLFLTPPQFDATGLRIGGGLGCGGCHRAPEFAIDPASGNNGIIGTISGTGRDPTVTRAPTLRELFGPDGVEHGPMMHTGIITTVQAAIGHYGTINANPANTGLDARLKPGGLGQRLALAGAEVNAVIAFLKTLSGSSITTEERFSDPFPR